MLFNNINYKIIGNGNIATIMLHGWGRNSLDFLPFCMQSKQTKNILIDFYGHGKTEFPDIFIDCYECALQIYLLLKSLKITKCNIVGHSFGGRIAIILSTLFDIQVEKLVLTGSAGIKIKQPLSIRYKQFCYKHKMKKTKNNDQQKEKLLKKYASTDYKNVSTNIRHSFKSIVNQYLDYLLPKITCKTMIVWGDNDKVTPIIMAKILNKDIQNSNLTFINGDHFAFKQDKENFNFIVNKFLNSN